MKTYAKLQPAHKMKNIVITGAVTSGGGDRTPLYSMLVDVCKAFSENVYSPLDVMEFKGTNQERYARAVSLLEKADVLVAEASLPSTGQGIDINEANRNKVPIVIVAKAGSKVSGLVLGSPMIKGVIYYDSTDELRDLLSKELQALQGDPAKIVG